MNWKQRIERAKKTGEFIAWDRKKALDSTTCALGEKFNLEKNYAGNIISYRKHESIGTTFTRCVLYDNIPQAEATYKKIQMLKI